LESVLRAAGFRTGLYLSPHLESVRERIQVGGRMIPEREFSRLLGLVLAADRQEELTYFELLTCVAFLHFQERQVEAAVLETGMGGRLDATNVVAKPLASVITSISLDHTQWLGKALSRIAFEKAGIIKPAVPVFCPALPGVALSVVKKTAKALQAPLTVVGRPFKTLAVDWRRNRQVFGDGRSRFGLSLLGSRQGQNLALAKAVLDGLAKVLPVSGAAWRRGAGGVRLPGRCEVVRWQGKTAIIDGAHNPEAMGAFARFLSDSPWREKPVLWIMGVMKDKDLAGIVRPVAGRIEAACAVEPGNARDLSAAALAAELRRQAPRAVVWVTPDPAQALRDWHRSPTSPGTAVVCGSFYLAGAALKTLRGGIGA